jgi:hypothetical protein
MPLVEPSDLGTTQRARLSPRARLAIWEHAKGICVLCDRPIEGVRERWIIEHIRAWSWEARTNPTTWDRLTRPAHGRRPATIISVRPKPSGRRSGISAPTRPNAPFPMVDRADGRKRSMARSFRVNDSSTQRNVCPLLLQCARRLASRSLSSAPSSMHVVHPPLTILPSFIQSSNDDEPQICSVGGRPSRVLSTLWSNFRLLSRAPFETLSHCW